MQARMSWLDFKLGFRMLLKYPGLTLVGGIAIAVGIGVAAAYFQIVNQLIRPKLPLQNGAEIVAIRYWNAATFSPEYQLGFELANWPQEIRTVRELGGFRTATRNLAADAGVAEATEVAEITSSAFRLARIQPLLGRSLTPADEIVGAPDVVVIGYDLWQSRFNGDRNVIGRTVRLGGTPATVVGVMPEGFGFPINHNLWVPLRLGAAEQQPGAGPQIRVLGRLAPGVTLRQAAAELNAVGQRAASNLPATHKNLRPEIMPYANSFFVDLSRGEFSAGIAYAINLVFVMFLCLVCANAATLVFARTAAREAEIAVRSALGASRGRIIVQLFSETLVLAGAAAIVGLLVTNLGLRWGKGVVEALGDVRLPFWWNSGLAPATIAYAAALTVLGAIVTCIVPAAKLAGSQVQTMLQRTSLRGSSMKFGGIWTAIIVTQVAATVFFLPLALSIGLDAFRARAVKVAIAEREYLAVRLDQDLPPAAAASAERNIGEFIARYRSTYKELERRLEVEPGVRGVTFADVLPRMDHEQASIEVEGAPPSPTPQRVSSAAVDIDYFDVVGAGIVAGRGFQAADLDTTRRVLVLNRTFVHRVLADRNAIGQRIRFISRSGPPGPWYEVIGVTTDLGMTAGDEDGAGLYRPVTQVRAYPVHMAVHAAGDPEALAIRLRKVAAEVDPTLRLFDLKPMDKIAAKLLLAYSIGFRLLMLVASIILLLSAAGIYSLMSFTVSRRTREIGIRIALGARSQRIVRAIFSRALTQVGIGVLIGVTLLVVMAGGLSARLAGLVAAGAGLMILATLIACFVPTRRALSIQPTEAFRTEG